MDSHTSVTKALDRLRREVEILWEMQESPPGPDDTDGCVVHNRLILAQSKKVRTTSNLLVRAIARERDDLNPREGNWPPHFRQMVRDNPQLQPKEGTSE